MRRVYYTILFAISVCLAFPVHAQVDTEDEAYKTQVPTGMELQQVGKKPSYRVVLPKGTAIRREGDLQIVEGSGEYASRKFVAYDAILKKMGEDIESLRNDVEEIKKVMAESRQDKLVSK